MAQITKVDQYAFKGSSKTFSFQVNSGGSAANLTGATDVTMSVYRAWDDTAVLFSLTSTTGVAGAVFGTGLLTFVMSVTNSNLLKSHCVYKLSYTPSGGTNTTVAYGDLFVAP